MKKPVMVAVGLMLGTGRSGTAAGGSEGLYLHFDSGSFSPEQGGETALVEGGIGYRVNQYLRNNITLAYHPDYGETL